jgi:hypothetical protein
MQSRLPSPPLHSSDFITLACLADRAEESKQQKLSHVIALNEAYS